jgi:hypothetical protein
VRRICIIPYGQKKYSPAGANYIRHVQVFRSGFKLDYRTKSNAEKKVIVEYKEQMLIKLDYLFLILHSNIKIPQEYVRGFQYYCVEDTDLGVL